jgi:hypothetical protein
MIMTTLGGNVPKVNKGLKLGVISDQSVFVGTVYDSNSLLGEGKSIVLI